RDGDLDAAVIVRDGQGAADGRAIRIAGRVEVAARCDHGQVGATPAGPRAALTVWCERTVHEAAVAGVEGRPAETARRHLAGRLRLEQDVGMVDEREEQLPSPRPLEVERDAALRGVEREPEERALGIRSATPERGAAARRIAARWLDLHDVRAEVAEELAGE